MTVGARQGGLSICETADLLGFSGRAAFTENGAENKQHPVSGSSASENSLSMREVSS